MSIRQSGGHLLAFRRIVRGRNATLEDRSGKQIGNAFDAATSPPALFGLLDHLERKPQEASTRLGAQVHPVFRRKVVEGEQGFAVLGELVGGLRASCAVALQQGIEGGGRLRSGRRHPDLVQRSLGLARHAPGQFVEHVGALVYSPALRAGLGIGLIERHLGADGSVAHRQHVAPSQAASLQVRQKFRPRSCRFAQAFTPADQFLGSRGGVIWYMQAATLRPIESYDKLPSSGNGQDIFGRKPIPMAARFASMGQSVD